MKLALRGLMCRDMLLTVGHSFAFPFECLANLANNPNGADHYSSRRDLTSEQRKHQK